MAADQFVVAAQYSKRDIYRICDVPTHKQRGSWNTGYTCYEGIWFIFCNVGAAGRTGHDYGNRFEGDDLVWFAKGGTHVGQNSIRSLLDQDSVVLIFYREDNRHPFTFAGQGKVKTFQATTPVQITWKFESIDERDGSLLPEEVLRPQRYVEGATRTISVNAYERSREARQACLEAHGYTCVVCGFDFEKTYGEIGKGYIHVHHLTQLADIGEEYELNAINDLRPVCPNCHAMLHQRRPPYSVEELQALMRIMAQQD